MVMLMRQNISEINSFLFFKWRGPFFPFWLFRRGGGYIKLHKQRRPLPPIEIAQFPGFSRFCFAQRPLCKVDCELCTEKRIPTATAQGYAQETVDKFWIRAVDNWGRLGKSGGESARGAGGPFQGYLHHHSQSQSLFQTDSISQ